MRWRTGDRWSGGLTAKLLLALVLGAFFPLYSNLRGAGESVRLFGAEYVAAADFGRRHGLVAKASPGGERMELKSGWTTLVLEVHSMLAILNGLTVSLAEPIVSYRGALYLSRDDADNVLRPILVPRLPADLGVPKVIAIDAGHGGEDPGNQNQRFRLDEKTFTLDVVRRLERLLKQRGYRVVLTRSRDRAVELEDRTAIARRAKADLFISVHFNSFAQPGVSGAEAYVLTPVGQRSSPAREQDQQMSETRYPGNQFDRWNVVLGYNLYRQVAGRMKAPDRGLKHFRYSVLRTIDCPAVLVEAAFLSNDAEARKIATPAYRQDLAEAIAAGVKSYADTITRLKAANNQ